MRIPAQEPPVRLSCSKCPSANPSFASHCAGCGHHLWKYRAFDILLIAAFVVCLVLLRKMDTTVP